MRFDASHFREIFQRGNRVLCVHSSLKHIGYIDGGPEKLIQPLLDAAGDKGTLIMPVFTYSFEGRNEYIPFDLKHSPSQTGLLTEIFRTWPGTIRSNHPTHSFAARGNLAEYITSDHSQTSAFGINSPLHKLFNLGGMVLLFGTGFESCSLVHTAEVLANVYYKDIFCWEYLGWKPYARIAGPDGIVEQIPLPEVPGCSKNFGCAAQLIQTKGAVEQIRLGNTDALLINAGSFITEIVIKIGENPNLLLCTSDECPACRYRRESQGIRKL